MTGKPPPLCLSFRFLLDTCCWDARAHFWETFYKVIAWFSTMFELVMKNERVAFTEVKVLQEMEINNQLVLFNFCSVAQIMYTGNWKPPPLSLVLGSPLEAVCSFQQYSSAEPSPCPRHSGLQLLKYKLWNLEVDLVQAIHTEVFWGFFCSSYSRTCSQKPEH